MQKARNFKLLWRYLRNDKLKLFIYIVLVVLNYLPWLLGVFLWGKALELLIFKDFFGFLLYMGLYQIIRIIFGSLLLIPKDFLYNYLEIKFTQNVSKDLYSKMLDLPAIAFEEIGCGEYINRLYTDPDRIMSLLSKLIKMICKFITVIIVLFIAFNVSWVLGLEIVIFGIIMGVISYVFFPKIKKMQELIKKDSDRYVKIATEDISGIREIKSLGIKRNIKYNMFDIMKSLFSKSKAINKYEVIYYCLNNLIYYILQFIILFTCGWLFVNGNIIYSVFIIIEKYLSRIDEVVESISDFGVNYNKVSVSLKRIDDIVSNKLYDSERFGNVVLNNVKGKIKFDNVRFRYREGETYTLKGLNLEILPNKKIAIVGRSGNGKSTIFNILLRYFDSTSGKVTLDDIDIKDLTEDSLRNNISIIRQSPFLFNLSILDNFRLVKKNATLKEIREVCKKAYIDDYIMNLPNRYNTIIGEGGVNLSGGQKQRMAIARTLLLNTKIILFDEATSALDNESQEYIKKTIDELVKDHTIIIVAHRLSTIVDADIINIIENGKLIASDSHNNLLKNCKVYQSLYKTELNESNFS